LTIFGGSARVALTPCDNDCSPIYGNPIIFSSSPSYTIKEITFVENYVSGSDSFF
jgi:hypothetical protein